MKHSKRVMIVEDDPLLSIVEEKMVMQLGYNVVGKAKSGEETLNLFKDLRPEVLLVDIQLAGKLNGIQTVERIYDMYSEIPVIFLSGDKSQTILQQAEKIPYIDFLLKPVSSTDLSKSLQKALDMKEEMLSHNAA